MSEEVKTNGIPELLESIQKETGKEYQPASLRVILRGLAKAGTIEKNAGRWSFTDEEMDTIVDHISKTPDEDPEAAADEDEAEKPAKKKAPAKKAPAKKAAKKKAAEPVEEEPEEVLEDDELDLEDL